MTRIKEKQKHLGRGLASLLGPITSTTAADNQEQAQPLESSNFPIDKELRRSMAEVSLETISANPHQPRQSWDPDQLAELAQSIRTSGVIQPIVVRPAGKGYQLIAGERRFRAAKQAGLSTIPAIIRQASDSEMLELALVENIHRTGLNPIERAAAYRDYITTFSLTQAEAARRLGEDRSVIANYMRLLELPEQIKQMLIDGSLSMGHARAILAVPTDELRRKLANRALTGRLSVREVEKLVKKYLDAGDKADKTSRSKQAHILELETKLSNYLGTKVNIETRKNGQRGRISIEFYTLDEFDRITEKIGFVCAEQA